MGKHKKRRDNGVKKRLFDLEKSVDSIARSLERARFYEYIQYVSDTRRILKRSFLMGILKGAGTAIGVTILGAIAIYALNILAKSNLPYIADFISDIIDIIERSRK